VSPESGKPQVYVQPFPEPSGRGRKVKISQDGGGQPTWCSRQGAVLLFPEWKLTAVDVRSAEFTPGIPKLLFQVQQVSHVVGGTMDVDPFNWDATADGKRFLIKSVPRRPSPTPSRWSTG
jgi:hypothetical protein